MEPHANLVLSSDPFNHITLEIPQQPLRHIEILLTRDCAETGPERPTKYCVSLPGTANIQNLNERLSEISGVPLSRLQLCEIHSNRRELKRFIE